MCSGSAINPGPVGRHASRSWVRALEAGRSRPANAASHPKWAEASSGDTETTGTFRVGFTNLVTPPECTRESHHRDDRDAGHEPRRIPSLTSLADVSGGAA